MNAILDFWAREPTLITQFVTQVIALLVSFGLPVTSDQRVALLAVVEAAGAIISAIIIRSQVTPPANLPPIPATEPTPPVPTVPVQP